MTECVKVSLKDCSENKQMAAVATWVLTSATPIGELVNVQQFTSSIAFHPTGVCEPDTKILIEGSLDEKEWIVVDTIAIGDITVIPQGVKFLKPFLSTESSDLKVTLKMYGKGI